MIQETERNGMFGFITGKPLLASILAVGQGLGTYALSIMGLLTPYIAFVSLCLGCAVAGVSLAIKLREWKNGTPKK